MSTGGPDSSLSDSPWKSARSTRSLRSARSSKSTPHAAATSAQTAPAPGRTRDSADTATKGVSTHQSSESVSSASGERYLKFHFSLLRPSARSLSDDAPTAQLKSDSAASGKSRSTSPVKNDLKYSSILKSKRKSKSSGKGNASLPSDHPIYHQRRELARLLPKQTDATPAASTSSSTQSAFATQHTPNKKGSTASRRNVEIKAAALGRMLEDDARERLDPRWLSIDPSANNEPTIKESLNTTTVSNAYAAVRDAQGRDEEALENGLVGLLTSYRAALRRQLGAGPVRNGDLDRCVSNSKYELLNPDTSDLESHKPDIVIPYFNKAKAAKSEDGERRKLTWSDVAAVIEVKATAADDLSGALTNQVYRYARKLVQYHPIASRVHVLTVCGPRVRLWAFEACGYATSRAYSLMDPLDSAHIGRILAFLCASRSESVMPAFDAGRTFKMRPAEGGPAQDWRWVGTPKKYCVRPELCGSRTVVLGGTAAPVDRGGVRPKKTPTDDNNILFVKLVFLPRKLLGHETEMQKVLARLSSTPTPLGTIAFEDLGFMEWDADEQRPKTTFSPRADSEEELYLHGFVFKHRQGDSVPMDLSERDLAVLFLQLAEELQSYAKLGVHYRDLNTGNILCQVGKGGKVYRTNQGRPRLVLCDHGNVRLNDRPRGSHRGPMEPRNVLQKVTMDDAKSANPSFLPSGMFYVNDALDTLRDTQASKSLHADAELNLKMYAHTFIDDLESACYVLMWLGLERSLPPSHADFQSLDGLLDDLSWKKDMWADSRQWSRALKRYCPAMTEEWRSLLVKMHDTIFEAQGEQRAIIKKAHFAPQAAPVEGGDANSPETVARHSSPIKSGGSHSHAGASPSIGSQDGEQSANSSDDSVGSICSAAPGTNVPPPHQWKCFGKFIKHLKDALKSGQLRKEAFDEPQATEVQPTAAEDSDGEQGEASEHNAQPYLNWSTSAPSKGKGKRRITPNSSTGSRDSDAAGTSSGSRRQTKRRRGAPSAS